MHGGRRRRYRGNGRAADPETTVRALVEAITAA